MALKELFNVSFLKLIFGFEFNGIMINPNAGLLVAFVLLLIATALIVTSLVLNITKKGNEKMQLALCIQIIVFAIAAGILFFCSKKLLYYGNMIWQLDGISWEEYSQHIKMEAVPYIMGAFSIVGGLGYSAANIIYNKK